MRSSKKSWPDRELFDHIDQGFSGPARMWARTNLDKAASSIERNIPFHFSIRV
jgi:hypothetical protein